MSELNDLIYKMRFERTDSDAVTQAVEYLRDYKDLLVIVQKLKNDFDTLTTFYVDDNPPLTWDELKVMEGKPVWVEADDGKYKGWVIVGKFYSLLEKEDLDAHVNLYYFGRSMEYSKEMYGYYWKAYRKERK